MKKKKLLLVLVSVLLVLAALLSVRPIKRGFLPAQTLGERSIPGAAVCETCRRAITGGLTRNERTYALKNGDSVVFGRMKANADSAYHLIRRDHLSIQDGTVRTFDLASGTWTEMPLSETQLSGACVYIEGSGGSYFSYLPIAYEPMDCDCLRETGSRGYISIEKARDGWDICLCCASLAPDQLCDYTVITSGVPLLDTSDRTRMDERTAATFRGDGRWCYTGYYRFSPDTYIPGGGGCLYRCVATYLTKFTVEWASEERYAEDLSLSTLDTVGLLQNDAGFFPTMPVSVWLRDDYSIPGGFYDTRFNSNLMLLYYAQMGRTGGFEEITNRYFDFYLDYAGRYHHETASGGWLVWDYGSDTAPVHCSLNHQLCEILVLCDFAEQLSRPELSELADRMLLGVEDTGLDWVREDGDLHYCYMPDGSYARDDYPYLTYNDLYDLQNRLEAMGRERNETLDGLMAIKLRWMQENGVTDFKGSAD